MSAVDWSAQPEPWRSVGLRFAAKMRGEPPPKPARNRHKGNLEVRQLRLAAGLSQADLGRLCGCSGALVSQVESGAGSAPDGISARRMLAALRGLVAA